MAAIGMLVNSPYECEHNSKPLEMLKTLALAIAVCLMPLQNADADAIAITTVSWHASNHGGGDTDFREVNPGLGYEHTLNQNNTLVLGFYYNSYNRNSDYLLDFWQPLQWNPDIGKIKFGIAMGTASGYDGDTFVLVAVPMLTYENKTWGLNLVTATFPLPQLAKRSVFALQVKINIP